MNCADVNLEPQPRKMEFSELVRAGFAKQPTELRITP
jgi:hypothetical protein